MCINKIMAEVTSLAAARVFNSILDVYMYTMYSYMYISIVMRSAQQHSMM